MNYEALGLFYLVSAVLFITGLKLLGSPDTARKGNFISALGMTLAIFITILSKDLNYENAIYGFLAGGLIGLFVAKKVAMTKMPEMVALFNGFGGLASLLVGCAALINTISSDIFFLSTVFLSILIGGTTFTGSLLAYMKLSERIPGRPLVYLGQRFVNSILLMCILLSAIFFIQNPTNLHWLYLSVTLSLLLGLMFVLPIGGADMPVVISLLNSFSGIAAATAGFAITNILLIVAGSLVGASGIILTIIMCKAMNRSLINVLFSGFGKVSLNRQVSMDQGEVKAISGSDAYYILEAATSVVIVPGYGMAVAQAQHAVKELQELLESNGAEVVYAIHPVAGRMPGHMNVLLAEADVPYDLLLEMDQINPRLDTFDVAIVIGANDVVNPAAREVKSSPIYGMPVINADKARTVFVLKRSMASGFAGIDNPLFFKENTRMIFGDAKETLGNLTKEFD